MTTEIAYPFTVEKIKSLKLGEMVSLSGKVFCGRDRLHKYLYDGGQCPVDLKEGAIFHCGPVVLRKDRMWVTQAAGPTTSMRQEPFMRALIRQYGIRVIIGKGGMGSTTEKACAEFGCVYLEAVGGAAQVINEKITRVAGVHFRREFGGAEAMWELEVSDLPLIVAIDACGRNLHRHVENISRRNLGKILKNTAPFSA